MKTTVNFKLDMKEIFKSSNVTLNIDELKNIKGGVSSGEAGAGANVTIRRGGSGQPGAAATVRVRGTSNG
ncbi:hypothetical protein BKI52_02135 [marine bacterium AO1-C]|nr:hypothetical protein BKI52_02135 [marine bacterium AO1-C]